MRDAGQGVASEVGRTSPTCGDAADGRELSGISPIVSRAPSGLERSGWASLASARSDSAVGYDLESLKETFLTPFDEGEGLGEFEERLAQGLECLTEESPDTPAAC